MLRLRITLILLICASSLAFGDPLWKRFISSSELEFARWVMKSQPLRIASVSSQQAVHFIVMPDGVELRTSVYLPNAPGAYPVILIRTPYNYTRAGEDSYGYRGIADYYVPKGYAVVIQTIRGRLESGGTYKLLSAQEIDDGYHTINWIASQSWSNGNVATMGVSHDGYTALAAGVRNPSALKLILSGGSPGDLRTDAFFANGCMHTGLLDYIALVEKDILPVYDQAFYDAYLQNVLNEPRLKKHDNMVQNVQLRLWDQLIPKLNKPSSTYWKNRRIRVLIRNVQAPTVHIAGLTEDGDMPDTVRNYLAMAQEPAIADRQRLILGWWNHQGSGPYGDLTNITPYLLQRIDAYLDYYLKGQNSVLLNEKPVQVYSKGKEKWVYSTKWPIKKGMKEVRLYLADNFQLLRNVPGNSGSESYETDPQIIPTLTATDNLETARDQLVYFTEPFTRKWKILGNASVRLFVSTDTRDADFLVLLFKKTVDGEVSDVAPILGMMQGRYRNGSYANPSLMSPGEIYELNIPISPVSSDVKKGERLGLLIVSNLNPYVVRNANTGKKIGRDKRFQTARIRVNHGPAYPSAITLTIHK